VPDWPIRKRSGFLAPYWCGRCYGLDWRRHEHGIHCTEHPEYTPGRRRKTVDADVMADEQLAADE
jgi:hypothetical protein